MQKSKILDLDAIAQHLRKFAQAREWEKFHSPKNLSMALIAESAELCEIFQWLTESESRSPDCAQLEHIRQEVADVQIYLIRIADLLSIDLADAVKEKMAANEKKYPADLVRGSAKKYNA